MKYLTLIALLMTAAHTYAADCGTDAGRPYKFDAVYTADMLANVEGGVRRRAAYLDNLDLTTSIDGDSAFGWSNTCLFVYGLYNNGARFSDGTVGDAQYVSNIETDVMAARLYEAWIEHFFPARRASVKMGLYDLNSEFYDVHASEGFINSAHGIGTAFSQTGENGPSIFPVTSLALRGELAIASHWRVRAAVLDAVAGDPQHPGRTAVEFGQGTLGVLETTVKDAGRRAGIGYWRYSSKYDDLRDGLPRRGNQGWYAFGEMVLPSAPAISVFARLGRANEDFNQFRTYFGAGVVCRGAITGSEQDELGFAVAVAETGSPYRAVTGSRANEVNFELTWRVQLSNNVSIQPDVQYVIHPDASSALGNALVVGIRGSIDFNPG